jgi:hypothetical protein
MNGCEKAKAGIQVQTPAKDSKSLMLGLRWLSVLRRRGLR